MFVFSGMQLLQCHSAELWEFLPYLYLKFLENSQFIMAEIRLQKNGNCLQESA